MPIAMVHEAVDFRTFGAKKDHCAVRCYLLTKANNSSDNLINYIKLKDCFINLCATLRLLCVTLCNSLYVLLQISSNLHSSRLGVHNFDYHRYNKALCNGSAAGQVLS